MLFTASTGLATPFPPLSLMPLSVKGTGKQKENRRLASSSPGGCCVPITDGDSEGTECGPCKRPASHDTDPTAEGEETRASAEEEGVGRGSTETALNADDEEEDAGGEFGMTCTAATCESCSMSNDCECSKLEWSGSGGEAVEPRPATSDDGCGKKSGIVSVAASVPISTNPGCLALPAWK